MEQFATDSFAGSALKQHIIWHDDSRPSILGKDRLDMLNEIQLLDTQ